MDLVCSQVKSNHDVKVILIIIGVLLLRLTTCYYILTMTNVVPASIAVMPVTNFRM